MAQISKGAQSEDPFCPCREALDREVSQPLDHVVPFESGELPQSMTGSKCEFSSVGGALMIGSLISRVNPW